MKKEKMSIEKMKNVLSHVLSREEMKEVMAGSGFAHSCGHCTTPYTGTGTGVSAFCYTGGSYGTGCVCTQSGAGACHVN